MTVKQQAAVAGLLVFVALGVGSLSWWVIELGNQAGLERGHLQQPWTVRRLGLLRHVAHYKTGVVDRHGSTGMATSDPAAPALPVTGDAQAAQGHLLDVVTPLDGRIESIGSCTSEIDDATKVVRGVKPGDRVAKGHLLATIWSIKIGERKHEFLTAASQLMFDDAALERLRAADVGQDELAKATRHRNASRARVERSEDILRSLMMDDAQIEALRRDAHAVHRGQPDYSTADKWEELEIHAPHDGVVASVDAAVGRQVEAGDRLFQIVEDPKGQNVEGQRLADSLEP